ncbi:hypothetical protein CA13_09360 [Planctomycetes bacterium CA13]|uniref:Uncharacterized protein n=1 Tax=Novipirellula herctigrandis TaxID=2527986 RepID=A0A5C5YWZ7_9BACT|nr:hypothetical protein CA13_09360 [Planctomycetes bacterium CA13]
MNRVPTSLYAAACLLTLASGCGPTAPSIANGPPAVTWQHLTSESWRYELQDPKRIANFSFRANGGVLWSEGTKNGNLHSVAALGGRWYINNAGDLVITDESESKPYRTLGVTALTATTATAIDRSTGLTEAYSRIYTPQTGG